MQDNPMVSAGYASESSTSSTPVCSGAAFGSRYSAGPTPSGPSVSAAPDDPISKMGVSYLVLSSTGQQPSAIEKVL